MEEGRCTWAVVVMRKHSFAYRLTGDSHAGIIPLESLGLT